ncbi:MAG TPA: hypothetical protein VET82_06925 [Candidatus Eisenbacteria bacterium]|nr:hypothetical protein [Candidatus Eisenbacteria bacterium]
MIGPGLIPLVYLACLGGLYAVMLARRGRWMYWLAVAGAALVLFGRLAAGFLDRSLTDPAFWGGLALAIVALALDLIVPARAMVADG